MTGRDEGYMKFSFDLWSPRSPQESWELGDLIHFRKLLVARNLIGCYMQEEKRIGFGNLGKRTGHNNHFYITASSTGHIETLKPRHFTKVISYDLDRNYVEAEGALPPSSESMTYAALFDCAPEVRAIVHIHNEKMWNSLNTQLPTTDDRVEYGTPEMAREIRRTWQESDTKNIGAVVMAGHQDGIITFGADVEQATDRVMELYRGVYQIKH